MQQLKNIGLTNNEILVYLFLLKQSSISATAIRKKTALANSRVYASLETLIGKGLVTHIVTAKGKLFSAVDPSQLLSKAEQQYLAVKSIIPDLKKIKNTAQASPKSAIYEGIRGFENAFHKIVDETPSNSTISIIGFSTQAYKNEQLRRLLNKVNKKSIVKKHKFRMIIDQNDNQYAHDRKKEGITDLRFMPREFVSPAGIDISDDKVAIFLWGESPYAIVIDDKNIAQSFQSYFEFLWSGASTKALAKPKRN